MKSYDMLTDLEHILTAFASLENPFVNLNRILRIKDPSYFSNYSAFVEFYTVLENLHADHRNNRSEEHTSELQSRPHLVCRLLLEKKKTVSSHNTPTTILAT